MNYSQYVEAGRRAIATEKQVGWKLAELAAGVERDHGALARWAEEVGITKDRATKLKKAFRVREESSVDATLSVSAAEELAPMPSKARDKFLVDNPEPSLRDARKAAEPYRAPKKSEPIDDPLIKATTTVLLALDQVIANSDGLLDDIENELLYSWLAKLDDRVMTIRERVRRPSVFRTDFEEEVSKLLSEEAV